MEFGDWPRSLTTIWREHIFMQGTYFRDMVGQKKLLHITIQKLNHILKLTWVSLKDDIMIKNFAYLLTQEYSLLL